ncbi:MAG: hypothetical protein JWM68_1599 [Verrucomicrobiales bacterium]|nr:hypothetical protein [Verrucomicrobiales bacterium]
MQNEKDFNKDKRKDANRDAITGEPGSHPVGTGVGAVAGGAAAGAAAGTVAGPIGTAAGMVGGAIVGGLTGKGVAEAVNPTEEEAYWREQHSRQWWGRERPYEQYQGAYRTGYEGYSKYGTTKGFEESEADLRRDYEKSRGTSKLSWEEARDASRAAWHKVQGRWERIIDFDVQESNGNKIGTVQNLWTDQNNQPTFLGVKTGWIFGKNHVVPVHTASVNPQQRIVRVPFGEDKVKDAPTFDPDYDLSDADEQRIYSYYGLQRPQSRATQPAPATAQRTTQTTGQEQANIKLSEEQLKVGKREVVVGGVRLRKVVRTEIVNQPVELKREEIIVERVPASEAQAAGQASFQQQDVFIPLRREEAVVEKEARVREEVRVRKQAATEKQTVSGQVRKEDVEIQKEGEEPRFTTETGERTTKRYEPKERGRP